MIRISNVDVDGRKVLGLCVEMPNAPPLIIMMGSKGMVVNRYLDTAIAEEYGVVAAMVLEAKSFDGILKKKVYFANVQARELGVEKGISVLEALKILA